MLQVPAPILSNLFYPQSLQPQPGSSQNFPLEHILAPGDSIDLKPGMSYCSPQIGWPINLPALNRLTTSSVELPLMTLQQTEAAKLNLQTHTNIDKDSNLSNSVKCEMQSVRLLMTTKEAGTIIGKKGSTIKQFREESGAKISISESLSNERIVALSGTFDQIQKGLECICQKFEEENIDMFHNKSKVNLNSGSSHGQKSLTVVIKMLVPAPDCGLIIGKGGNKIREFRESNGTSIQVATEVLQNSTERVVTVSGSFKTVSKCIRKILEHLIENSNRLPFIPYLPANSSNNPGINLNRISYPNPYLNLNSHFVTNGLPNLGLRNDLSQSSSTNLITQSQPSILDIEKLKLGAISPYNMNALLSNSLSNSLQGISSSMGAPIFYVNPSSQNLHPSLTLASIQNQQLAQQQQQQQQQIMLSLAAAAMDSINTWQQNQSQEAFNVSMNNLTQFPTSFFYNNLKNEQSSSVSSPSFCNPLLKIDKSNAAPSYSTASNCSSAILSNSTSPVTISTTFDPYSGLIEKNLNSLFSTNLKENFSNCNNELITSINSLSNNINQFTTYTNIPESSINTNEKSKFISTSNQNMSNMCNQSEKDVSVKTYKLEIPSEYIGCVIGREGSKIREIRQMSNAEIKIFNPKKDNQKQDPNSNRKITIIGTDNQIQVASTLINQSIETFRATYKPISSEQKMLTMKFRHRPNNKFSPY